MDTTLSAVAIGLLTVLAALPEGRQTEAYPHIGLKAKGCERLSNAIYHVYRYVLLPGNDAKLIQQELMFATGVDFEDKSALKRFACALEGSKTLEDLAQNFKLPYKMVRQSYNEMMSGVTSCGGVEGCRIYMSLMNDLSEWARDVGYPTWPLSTTRAKVVAFLRHMVATYGEDFWMTPGFYQGPRPDFPLLITEDNLEETAEAITDAKSLSELATRTGNPKFVLAGIDEGLLMLVKGGDLLTKSNAAILELMEVANDLGLLYLTDRVG